MKVSGPAAIIAKLADTVSKNGNLLLNLSPKADGTFPQEQQDTLLAIGQWLSVNGDAIYGSHNWTSFAENSQRGTNIRFTVKGENLYAIILGQWPSGSVTIKSLPLGQKNVKDVTLLGNDGSLTFTQDAAGLTVKLPATAPCKYAYTLKIAGAPVNGPTTTDSGNPQ